MKVRALPGTLVLGLLASLIVHAAVYGGGHEMGGAYHALLLQAALAGALSLLAFLGSLAWAGAGQTADGSILATRLAQRLPGAVSLIVGTSFWYTLAERIEPQHAATPAPVVVLFCVAVISWLVLRLAHIVVRMLANVVLGASRLPWATRTPRWIRHAPSAPIARRLLCRRRRFARPPPSVSIACA